MKKSEIDKVEVLDPNATLDIEKVIGWDKNAREIHPKDFERLKVQIVELGDYKPIIVEKTAEGFTALGGNMRLKAYRELGYKKVWAIVVKPKDDEQRLKLALSDNDRAGYYIADLLAENLKNVNFKNLSDYKVDIRIPDIDMTDILDRAMKSVENEDNVPAVRETSIKIGDMFNLGQHRLLCGDSTLQANVERLMGGKKADMVFTDPPYNVNYIGAAGGPKREGIKNDKMSDGEFEDFLFAAMTQAIDNTKGGIYVCMGYSGINALRTAHEKAGGHFSTFIIWAKSSFTLGHADYHHQYEILLYGWPETTKKHYFTAVRTKSDVWESLKTEKAEFDGKETTITLAGYVLKLKGKVEGLIQKRRQKTDIWRYDKPRASAEHPTMKPVALVEEAITNSSRRGETVLDLFTGSGTTLIAAEKTGRIFRGMELDPVYCQVIIDRWEDFTGKKAEVLI